MKTQLKYNFADWCGIIGFGGFILMPVLLLVVIILDINKLI